LDGEYGDPYRDLSIEILGFEYLHNPTFDLSAEIVGLRILCCGQNTDRRRSTLEVVHIEIVIQLLAG
jgi:hypothetical protein